MEVICVRFDVYEIEVSYEDKSFMVLAYSRL